MGSELYICKLKFFQKIVWLSFVLAVAIVVRHSVNVDVYRLNGGAVYWFQKYVSVVTDIVVPLFFMISGYLFYQNFDYSGLTRKWKTRIFSLVIPYVIWNLAAYCYYKIITLLPIVSSSMSQTVEPFTLKSFFDNAIWGLHNVTWFIRYLIVYVFITPLFYFALRRKALAICTLVFLLVVDSFVHNRYYTYASIFLCGGIIGVFWRDLVHCRIQRFVIVFSVGYLIATTIFELVGLMESIKAYTYPLLRISQGMVIWMAFDLFEPLSDPPWWAKLAFPIYVMHSMVLESVEKIFLIALGRTLLGSVVDFLFAPILTLCIIFWISKLMKNYARPVWYVIMGGRGI